MSGVTDLVLLSRELDDIDYFTAAARLTELDFHHVRGKDGLTRTLASQTDAVLVWDAGHRDAAAVREVLPRLIEPSRVLELREGPPAGGRPLAHGWVSRRYMPGAVELFARLLANAVSKPAGLAPYFPKDVKIQKIALRGSDQKNAAVEATQRFLAKAGIDERLSALAAQAVDELLMNAIFDAPVDKSGVALRRNIPRHSQFLFGPTERVGLEIARTEDVVGLCVTDGYGSVEAERVLAGFSRVAKRVAPSPGGAPSGGVGLHGIAHAGLSLVLACEPGRRTDAMVFFPRVATYRAFRKGFQVTACLTARRG
jgi:hypothetical protein